MTVFQGNVGLQGENPVGEAKNGAKTLHFDGSIKLEFRGARVVADGGPLVAREPDETLGLTDMAASMLSEARAGNRRHDLAGPLKKSVYARLAGYEGAGDREALSRDPAMRAASGRKAPEAAASPATVAGFETEIPASDDNLEAPAAIIGARVARGQWAQPKGAGSSRTRTHLSPRCTRSRRVPPQAGISSPSATIPSSSSTSTATVKEQL